MPIQLDFIIRRLAEMAQSHPELRERQPWKAVATGDLAWFGSLMTEHYAGDDTNVRMLGAYSQGSANLSTWIDSKEYLGKARRGIDLRESACHA
jgi:hypothetical protein